MKIDDEKRKALTDLFNEIQFTEFDVEEVKKVDKELAIMEETNTLEGRLLRFCHEYVIDYRPTDAAKRAGVTAWDAHRFSNLALKNDLVKAKIQELEEESMQNLNITKERVLKEYAKIAFTEKNDFEVETNDDGSSHVVSKTLEVKTQDKLKALDSLSKYFGLYEKDNKRIVEFGFKDFLQSLPPEIAEEVKFALMKRVGKS